MKLGVADDGDVGHGGVLERDNGRDGSVIDFDRHRFEE